MSNNKNCSCVVCGSDNYATLFFNKDYTVSEQSFEVVSCLKCSFVWTKNPPLPESIGEYYISDEYISHSDVKNDLKDKLFHFARRLMLNKKSKLIESISTAKKGVLLDIGCGTGYFLNKMQYCGWNVFGFEPSDNARSVAANNFNLNIFDSNELYKFDKKVDVITMWHVLEHVYDLDGYIKKFSEILNDDGLVVVAVPNIDSFDSGIYKSEWAALDTPRHLWHFNSNTISLLFVKYGFKVERKIQMPFDAFYISMLSEKNLTGNINWLKVFTIGIVGFFKSILNKDKSSSLIYIIKKKGTV